MAGAEYGINQQIRARTCSKNVPGIAVQGLLLLNTGLLWVFHMESFPDACSVLLPVLQFSRLLVILYAALLL